MLKAPLTYHDPADIYDYFLSEAGPIYMLVKKNHAIVRFEDASVIRKFLIKSGIPIVKGMPLRVSLYQEGELDQIGKEKDSSKMDE
jgi:hypothetical protein